MGVNTVLLGLAICVFDIFLVRGDISESLMKIFLGGIAFLSFIIYSRWNPKLLIAIYLLGLQTVLGVKDVLIFPISKPYLWMGLTFLWRS